VPSGPSTPIASQAAKPRLVAKSAIGGLGSRSGLVSNGGSSVGPDASKVWNKNRRKCTVGLHHLFSNHFQPFLHPRRKLSRTKS
jgi:hypothetical protein